MAEPSPSLALFTDLYELTMAQAYWQSGTVGEATFSLFFRQYPPDRGYFVFGGLKDSLDYLEGFHFTDGDIAYLRGREQFNEQFLDYLTELRFTGSVRAMDEGAIFFTNEPVMEVTGPIIEAQMVETYLLNQVNVQTVLATKASRVMHAAQGRLAVDFAARRTHGTDAADKLGWASYVTGFAGTSNVHAAALYGIPAFGTMAHSLITAFPSETKAFHAYANSFPDTSTLLVDTYDTVEGVKKAVGVAKELERDGHRLRAIRLDSGDFLSLSKESRRLLDEAGLDYVQVFASGGLDEFDVERLVKEAAPIDGFGVGTKLGVSADAPWTDCAYKLVEYNGRPVLKLSTDKQTLPGSKQVYRSYDAEGSYAGDVIATADETPTDSHALLHEHMHQGKRTVEQPELSQLRERFAGEFARLPKAHKALRKPDHYAVSTSPALDRLQAQVVHEVTEQELGG